MKITSLQTFMCNAGLRNYLFVRLTTDTGLHGIGEASLEWQERAVEVLLNEWVASRIVGRDPFDVESVVGGMIRDQYQGGATVMTAISGTEIALWDLIGKACGQPVYRLLGGRCRETQGAYANGWYGGCRTPEDFARRAADVTARGYRALKFDPFATAWKSLDPVEEQHALAVIEAVARAVGPAVGLMIEMHGRFGADDAIRFIRKLASHNIVWCEEPVAPESLDLLKEVKSASAVPIASGERLYTLADFARLIGLRACDVVQMDVAHCGGLAQAKKVAAFAAAQDLGVSPHCSIGPVALAAALHFAWSTPNMRLLECFAEFDVDWRDDLVAGWTPLRNGAFLLPEAPGLGLDLDIAAIERHGYRPLSFPSLWDQGWERNFTGASDVPPVSS
ncbi:MAG TPA: mandelate racemase/muconate lactonizing enzyme family protein [Lichenihabitans sp.]|jgi:galactonate dehydratase|nr:mandelate racemase/muconate lactonizing enzyme family protein [Lichenihabitans sp.]